MQHRCVAYGLKVAVLASAILAAAGCAAGGSGPPRTGPTHARPVLLTGVRLSAVIQTPAGFTLNRSASFNSGTRQAVPVPGAANASSFDCASWWSGKAYFGPGTIGYAIKQYTGPSRVTLRFDLNLYPAGTGAGVFAMSAAVQRRCRRFSYMDKNGLRYTVKAAILPSRRMGDRSLDVDATETAPDGAPFTTETTFVEVGDVLVAVNETGAAGALVNRDTLTLPHIVAGLRSAGY